MKVDIEVVPYDPNWPILFEEQRQKIAQVLGENCVAVYHIGSTSVPGLSAKPKIDIIAEVKRGADAISPLEKVGFEYRGEWNIPLKFGFTKRGDLDVNLHVFEAQHPEIELNLVFRDHLRTHPESLALYAKTKEDLLIDEASFQKQEGKLFSGYNLGKDAFIRSVLEAEGYKRHRFLTVTHHKEWEDYHRIRKALIFDPIGVVYDPNHSSILSEKSHHFLLTSGCETATVAHIEFLDETTVAIRSLATDTKFQNQGYGQEMMALLEKWLKRKGVKIIKMHSRLSAEAFYRKLGYTDIPFDDPCIKDNYVNLGKEL